MSHFAMRTAFAGRGTFEAMKSVVPPALLAGG
jgi:hypothetical protein